MGMFRTNQTIAANGTVANLMTGDKFEFLPRGAVIKVYAAQDVVVGGLVQLDFTLGIRVQGDNLPLTITLAGVGPNRDSDLLASGVGLPGERIQLRAREIAGVAVPIRVFVEIIDV